MLDHRLHSLRLATDQALRESKRGRAEAQLAFAGGRIHWLVRPARGGRAAERR